MEVSHLSEDSTIAFSVKEFLKAKENNAREDRALQYKYKILQRAEDVIVRTADHQQTVVQSRLGDIYAKTPYLDSFAAPIIAKTRQKSRPDNDNEYTWARYQSKIRRAESLPQVKSVHFEDIENRENSGSFTMFPVTKIHEETSHNDRQTRKIMPTLLDEESLLTNRTRNHLRKSRYIETSLKRVYERRRKRLEPPNVVQLRPPVVSTMQRAYNILQSRLAFTATRYRPTEAEQDEDDNTGIIPLAHPTTMST